MENNELQIGDSILCKNPYSTYVVDITRVSKTLAIGSIRNVSKELGATIRFKRAISSKGIERYPKQRFSTTNFTLIEK